MPAEFWANRDFFFYEGMKMEIGPSFKDYGPPPEYLAASAKYKGQPKIGPDESLENYNAGFAFDPASIDCKGDPQAGVKHIWNFAYQWDGDGSDTHYFYSYWDRGEELPLYYEGTSKTIMLSHRVEPELVEKNNGDLFRGEKRVNAFGIEVDAPFDARGILVMSYRYKDSEKPTAQTKNDDTWVYVPTLRRVRRISTAQRTDAVSGTDFTFDDLRLVRRHRPAVHLELPRRDGHPRAGQLEGGCAIRTRRTTTSVPTASPMPTIAGSCARP